ncbi:MULTISPECIES: type 4 pilus major pilin [unclassified Herbaspirillum]|uniref:type 4 pilus major pilin n=1 Tax=unclassified Herbaspirillum TaxID=2624150 RepID=UPI001820F778|nr:MULTISPECIES: type 4 pilus major pilin [unclassified Herbaspirillum]MBB5390527.1 type II secretory pathway pseudopilin PulG [Herbaspirillum sp. SJZ102]
MGINDCGRDFERQRGFTLIEALVVMIVGIVILAAAAAGIGKLFRSSEISTEAQNITQIAASVRGLKSGVGGYKGLDNTLAIQYKAIPANMAQDADAGIILNVWTGKVAIKSLQDDQAFSITYPKVPEEACQQLLLKLRSGGWASVTSGEGGGKAITPSSSLSDIQAACTSPDSNTLTFTSLS